MSADRQPVILLIVCGAQFLLTLDIAVLQLALPDLGRELGLAPAALQAVNACYLAAFAGSLLPAGGLADRLGAARVFGAGVLLLIAGSVVGGLGSNLAVVALARIVQGLGGGCLLPAALALLGATFAEGPERDRATGWWTVSGVVGVIVGVLLGGLAAGLAGWRGTFWLGALLALPLALGPLRLFPPAGPPATAPIDGRGVLLSGAGFAAVTVGLALVGSVDGWLALAVLALGLVVLAGFVRHLRGAPAPLVRLDSLRSRTFAAALLAGLVHGVGPNGMLFLLSLYLQDIRAWSPFEVGAGLLPAALVAPIGAHVALRLVRIAGTRRPTVAGLAIMAGAFLLAARLDDGSGYLTLILPALVVMGLGATLASVPIYIAALADCPPDELGGRSALLNAAQYLGPAIGLTAMAMALDTDGITLPGLAVAMITGALMMLLAAAGVQALHPGPAVRQADPRLVSPG